MFSSSILAASLLGAASALPSWSSSSSSSSTSSSSSQGISFDANFDDLTAVPAVSLAPVGQYDDLYYNALLTTELGVLGVVVTGLYAHSGDNVAAAGLNSEILSGTPELTVDYTGSEVQSFDLKSFYYGCVLTTVESVVGVPASCTVQVTGYDSAGKGVANQEFDFVADGLVQEMVKATLSSSFKGLYRVELTTEGTASTVIATLFDDFVYTVYKS